MYFPFQHRTHSDQKRSCHLSVTISHYLRKSTGIKDVLLFATSAGSCSSLEVHDKPTTELGAEPGILNFAVTTTKCILQKTS